MHWGWSSSGLWSVTKCHVCHYFDLTSFSSDDFTSILSCRTERHNAVGDACGPDEWPDLDIQQCQYPLHHWYLPVFPRQSQQPWTHDHWPVSRQQLANHVLSLLLFCCHTANIRQKFFLGRVINVRSALPSTVSFISCFRSSVEKIDSSSFFICL